MTSLEELLVSVKEPNLTKSQLELYHATLSSLFADMQIEIAGLKKEEARFFLQRTSPDVPDVRIKRQWRGSESGQRLIELEAYCKATAKMISSLKSRLFSIY